MKKAPPSAEDVARAKAWEQEKLASLPKDGHPDEARLEEMRASGEIDEEKYQDKKDELASLRNVAETLGLGPDATPDEIVSAAHGRLQTVNGQNYDLVQSGEKEHPAGVTPERLKLAVEGDEDGRVPLTYKGQGGVNDIDGAKAQMQDFNSDVAGVMDQNGITDATVVQVGSGTTGWKNNPMKYIKHLDAGGTDESWFDAGAWTPRSDTDLAVFSDQMKVGAMEQDVPINPDYGIYKTGQPGVKPGFSNTDVGGDLYDLGKRWDDRSYDPATRAANPDGLFDFKLNIGNDPFTTPPTVYRGPATCTPDAT